MIENKNILVTGGAGFIGSSLCEALLKNGNKVTCMDNFSTGKLENILPLTTSSSKFRILTSDIRLPHHCKEACEGMDYVFHEAALGSVPRSVADPLETNEVNVTGFLNMLTAARNARVKRFIYASSSSVYGDSNTLPKVEEEIGNPLSPYAVSKYTNELYAGVYSKTYGLKTIGLRYFNVFGHRQNPKGDYAAVIPKFITRLINHESPVIYGDGSYSRDFTYVEDVVQANLLALEAPEEALNSVYNVASGGQTTVNGLFDLIKDVLSFCDGTAAGINPVYKENRAGDVPHSVASIEKAGRLLGYHPQFDVQKALQKTIVWYYAQLKTDKNNG
jgi:UDP-N-acetylglucosamine 4-epimerase